MINCVYKTQIHLVADDIIHVDSDMRIFKTPRVKFSPVLKKSKPTPIDITQDLFVQKDLIAIWNGV